MRQRCSVGGGLRPAINGLWFTFHVSAQTGARRRAERASHILHLAFRGLVWQDLSERDSKGSLGAKSRLTGTYDPPGLPAGPSTPLLDGDEQIGLVLRTRANVNPLFVSIAHRVDLESAKQLVLACCAGYRVPEPTRQADIEVAKLKRGIPPHRGF